MRKAYSDILTALCIWREARNQTSDAMLGVAWVIRNRVSDARWPDTAAEVVLQRLQFSSFNRDDVNSTLWPKPDDEAWIRCCDVVQHPLADPTHGANHYHSFLLLADYPDWADERKLSAKIGAFRFYKL